MSKKIYRLQSNNSDCNLFRFKQMPVKRVSIFADGSFEFNPDGTNYIYFSKTKEHHAYYLYNKALKVLNGEVKTLRENSKDARKHLPEDFRSCFPGCHSSIRYSDKWNVKAIKEANDYLKNYVEPIYFESVGLTVLDSFYDLVDGCMVRNSRKHTSNGPELTDTRKCGGAYGFNSSWLDLLKVSTIETQRRKISLTQFLDCLLDDSYFANAGKSAKDASLGLYELLNDEQYTTIPNPQFYAKNNANDLITALMSIENDGLYNGIETYTPNHFASMRSQFKAEMLAEKEM